MIAFLHTTSRLMDKFEGLAKKYAPETKIMHFVNESLLSNAINSGIVDKVGFRKEIEKIKAMAPKTIICTCSTYGDECDQLDGVYRIDRPIVGHLTSNYNNILLAYSSKSTEETTKKLFRDIANGQGKHPTIVDCNCTDCWKYFEAGDMEKYYLEISNKIKPYLNGQKFEAIFLAQASMEGATKYLSDIGVAIFTSPEFGVKAYLQNGQ